MPDMPAESTANLAEETAIQSPHWSQIPKSRRGRAISPVVKSQAIALFAAGHAKIQIARALNIAPQTVRSWLGASEIAQLVPEAQDRLKAMIPKAGIVVDGHLNRNSLQAATFVLKGTGVVSSEGISVNVNVMNVCPQDWANRYQLPAAQAVTPEPVIEGEAVNVGPPTGKAVGQGE